MSKRKSVSTIEQLYQEPNTEYRHRVVLHLLQKLGPKSTDELTLEFSNTIGPVSKETLRRSLDVLEHRGLVTSSQGEDDKRNKIWTASA